MKKIMLVLLAGCLWLTGTVTNAAEVGLRSIKLQAKGQEVYWLVDGQASQGFKVLWSKQRDPQYPLRSGDRYHYLTDNSARRDTIEAFEGRGIYYVRVCQYIDDRCGLYSNQVMVELGSEDDEDKPYCAVEGQMVNEQSEIKCCQGLSAKEFELGAASKQLCYKAEKGEPICKDNVWYYSNGSILRKGSCPSEQLYCTMEYKPVCGKDGKTYGNACMAKAAKVEVAAQGECGAKIDLSKCLSYFDGCNTCTVNDGQLGGCTKKYCAPEAMEPAKCLKMKESAAPSKDCLRWYDGCNECSVKDGKIVSCTERFCVRHDTPKCLEKVSDDSETSNLGDLRQSLGKLQVQLTAQEKEIKQLKDSLARLSKLVNEQAALLKKLVK